MDESGSSEVSGDVEVVKKMEDEHLRLQRQFRVIQTDRLHRTMGVHPQFRSQDHLLRTLKREYNNLNMDLKIARSGAHKNNVKKMKRELCKLMQNWVASEQDVEGGLAIMEELDGLLSLNKKEMMALRQLAITNRGELDARRVQSENRLMHAENKLEAAMLRFNTIQWENKKIREEIEHMLKDRALFNQAWDKMLTALGKGKKFLSDLFESSTLAYDQRDEWVAKLSSVQEKGRMDQMMQVQEMRDLKKAYDHEMKIYDFLSKKGVMRVNRKQEERELEQKRKAEEEYKEKMDEHLKILNDISDYTQESSTNKIIQDFEKREFLNFSIYKLLTDYCAENEVLRRDMELIRRDIMDRRDYNEAMDSTRETKLEKLRAELEELQDRTDALRKKRDEQDQIVDNAMEEIQEMFKMLDCTLEPFQNLLGDKQPTLYTLKLSLRLITERIKEYVEVVFYRERALRHKDKTSTSRLKKYTIHSAQPELFTPVPISVLVPADPCPSCIESRWLSQPSERAEAPLRGARVRAALRALARDAAYVRSDRLHALADCRASASRRLLATRHLHY